MKFLSVKTLAEKMEVEASTIREWARMGKIPASKIGRVWRFIDEDIEKHLRNGYLDDTSQGVMQEERKKWHSKNVVNIGTYALDAVAEGYSDQRTRLLKQKR